MNARSSLDRDRLCSARLCLVLPGGQTAIDLWYILPPVGNDVGDKGDAPVSIGLLYVLIGGHIYLRFYLELDAHDIDLH